MNCTVVYGLSRTIRHEVDMPVADAFRSLDDLRSGWAYLDIYYKDRLVYTTQGAA